MLRDIFKYIFGKRINSKYITKFLALDIRYLAD